MTVNRFKPWVLVAALSLATLGGAESGVSVDAFAMEPGKTEPVPPPAADAPSPPTDTPPPPMQSANPMSGKVEAIAAGRKLYFIWCIQCHGPKADGVSRFGQYASDLRKFWRGYREFVTIVKDGRTARQMPPWKEVLDETKIAQVGAFLETLAIEDANWR